jgi:acyl-CoA synthetase (NDP forming)
MSLYIEHAPRSARESFGRCSSLLLPESVAVIGASPRESTLHGRVLRNLIDRGYRGPIFPINSRYEEIAGLACYPSVGAVGCPIGLALVVVRAELVPQMLDECIAAGVKAAIIFSAGFAESGPEGRLLQAELEARADRIAIGGPNMNAVLSQPVSAGFGFGPTLEFPVVDGPRALISHSGAVGTSIVTRAVERGLGFRYIVATGNEVDLGVEDYLFFLAQEAEPVSSCLLFLETVRDVPRFVAAAAACRERGIRIIALKVGRSQRSRDVSATHTAAMTGPYALYRALFDKLGIWSVETLEELYLCAQFDWWDDAVSGALAVLSFSGGAAAIAADEAERAALPLAGLTAATRARLTELTGAGIVTNPFDGGGQVVNDPPRWTGSLEAMASDPEVYGVVASLSAVAGGADGNLVDGIIDQAARGRNVALLWPSGTDAKSTVPSLSGHRIPVFDRIEDGMRCLKIRSDNLLAEVSSNDELERYAASLDTSSGGKDRKLSLEAVGVETPRERSCDSADAAAAAFEEFGGTVVLKATALLHKSDSGGVVTGLRSGPDVHAAADRLGASHGFPILVQEQVSGTREVLIGFSRGELGVAVVIGAGGVLAELLADSATLLAPFTQSAARRAIEGLTIGRLLSGYRGLGDADISRIGAVAQALGEFAVSRPDVSSVDLNPLILSDDGTRCWAVDIKLVEGEPHIACVRYRD